MTFSKPIALAACLALAGCADRFLPNTDVEDTPESRKIVSFCEAYRKAVERKDVPTLLGLASPDYYEEGPNVDASDDIDYAGLRGYLGHKFDEMNNIRYEIRYRRITWQKKKCLDGGGGDEACDRVFVDYTYSGSYRVATNNEGDKWKSTVEENRLELVPSGETFQIISGM
jgi:hypothetical protein